MTKTTNTLAELVPRFDKPRSDRHGIDKDASAETDRVQDRKTFSHLVKHTGAKVQRADAAAKQVGAAPDASEQASQADRSVEQDADVRKPQSEAANSSMQLKAKLVSAHGAINSTDVRDGNPAAEPDAEPKALWTARTTADVSHEDDVREAVAAEANAKADIGRRERNGPAETAKMDGVGEAVDVGQPSHISEPARQATVQQNEAVPPDRVRAMPLSEGMPPEATRVESFGAAFEQRNDAAGRTVMPVAVKQPAVDEAAHGGVSAMPTPPANPDAKNGASFSPGADGNTSRISGARHAMDTDGVERLPIEPRRLDAMAGRSADEVKPVTVDRTAPVAPTAVLADASTVRRLADAAQALRRSPDRAMPASDQSNGANENGKTTVERVVLQTPVELPEQRARRAFEMVTVQRSLAGREQMPAANEAIEIKAPDLSAKGIQREGAMPATASPGFAAATSAANIYGQLVQGLASADVLPKSGAEFRLLAMQNGVGNALQPLKVLQLQLQPKELGEVAVRIAMRGDKLELRVQVARQATAELIRSDQRVLVEALQQKNFDIENVTIQVADPDRGAGNQSGLSNGAHGRAGQGDSFQAASQEQTSRQNGGLGKQNGNGETDHLDPSGDGQTADGVGARNGIYL
ncbi:MAG: flagellar hook-length control protein FliK [Hyphomicrobiaceae bacterium]